jgi:hypothetical protein
MIQASTMTKRAGITPQASSHAELKSSENVMKEGMV